MRIDTLASLAILLWLSYSIALWPLPPDQTAELVVRFKAMIAEPPPWTKPEWKDRSQSDQEVSRKLYQDAMRDAQEIVDRADEVEVKLWSEWGGRAILLSVAILSWVRSIKCKRGWRDDGHSNDCYSCSRADRFFLGGVFRTF
jgi:hypothetical protein